MTAAELMAQLEKDPEYQRRKAEQEAELAARTAVLAEAEQPIVADLRAAGYDVESVWDLVNTSAPYRDALPILMRHLEQGGYPDRVMESMGRALAVKPAVVYWDRLRKLYLNPRCPGERAGAAVALAAVVTADQYCDLLEMMLDDTLDSSRVHFVNRIFRLGGARGREIVAGLQGHPVLGREATALITGRDV